MKGELYFGKTACSLVRFYSNDETKTEMGKWPKSPKIPRSEPNNGLISRFSITIN